LKREGHFSLLVGIHPVESALATAPERIRCLVLAAESRNPRAQALAEESRKRGVRVVSEPRAALDRRSGGARHQDVIAEFEPGNLWGEKDLDRLLDAAGDAPLVLVLDGVQDPHNLGACLRTADAAGVGVVVLPKDKSAGLTPAARRAAAGAAEVLPIVFVPNLARVLRHLKDKGLWVAGTTGEVGQSLHDADLRGPLVLVMGSEGKGMRRLTAELCDYRLRIPMFGKVDSLNVSVATAVCLYEIVRQRGRP
jgi:23S rRNA (guanosine2251-2'-O)-methyltransferase